MVELDKSVAGSTVKVASGEQARISLPETRTAGYHWQIVSPTSPLYSINDDGFEPAPAVGGTGVHRWTLTAKGKGSAPLAMSYGRSWGSASAAQTFQITIAVGS